MSDEKNVNKPLRINQSAVISEGKIKEHL